MMKPKSGDKGTGEAGAPSMHSSVVPSSKNVIIPGSSVMARRSANIQKANDGSLIYRRRHSVPSSSAVMPESKGADVLVQTRSQGKDASRSRMSLPIETRSDRKRPADSDLSQSMSVPKRRRTIRNTADGTCVESDAFCWICHRDGQGVCCELCPRLYHIKCLGIEQPSKEWICPECEKIMIAENTETRSKAMSMLSMETLCTLLKFVLQRMKYPETDPFHRPVDCALIPTYTDFIFNAMDFSTLEKNIKKKAYGSTEAFVADVKWILHNCIVFNGKKHRLTNIAKTILKVCRHETNEIEVCPDCYMNSCVKPSENWFCQPCRTPHILVWAKMKGYPFWPAKVLREDKGLIDVRFFGEHDRAWVPVSQIFMMSEEPPTSLKNRKGFEQATEELRKHTALLREKFGSFTYAAHRTPYDPNDTYSKVNLSVSPPTPQSFRSKRIAKSKPIMKVRNVDETQKGVKIFISKISDKPTSITKKTASAVRLKYNSIISTRMISAKKTEFSAQEAAPRAPDTEVLELGNEAGVRKMMQSESDAISADGVPKESSQDGSRTSTGEMELCHDEQNVSLSTSETRIKELEVRSTDRLDADASISENLERTSEIDVSCRSDKSQTVNPAVCIMLPSEESESLANTANDISTDVLGVSENESVIGSICQNSDNVSSQTSKAKGVINHDQTIIQDASCSSSTSEIQSDLGITSHCDASKDSDSVCTAVTEISESETVLNSKEPASQIDKSGCSIDLHVMSSGACKSTCNAEEGIVHTLEELPETIIPSDSLEPVLSSASTSKDGMDGDVQKGAETQLGHVVCESEERHTTDALEAVSRSASISSDAGLSLDNASFMKNPVLESGVSAVNLESSPVQTSVSATVVAAAVDMVPCVIETTTLLTSCESDIKLVSHADSDEVHALKASMPALNEQPMEIAADVSASNCVEKNSSVESDADACLEGPSYMPAGLDSSILKSLVSDAEERAIETAVSRSVQSPLATVVTETAAGTAGVASLSPPTDANTKLSSNSVAADRQTKMLSTRDVPAGLSAPCETNADDLLMEVDCEDDAPIVVIDDDADELLASTTMKIKDVKSLQPAKNLLTASNAKNVEEAIQLKAALDPIVSQALPVLQNFSQPATQRSPYLATMLSKTSIQTTTPNLPSFPMKNLVLAVSGTSTQCSAGSAISGQLSVTGSAAMCQSLLLNTGISSPGISANSADQARPSGASSFEFNIEGFDYSKYTNKIIDSTKSMLKEFCQDMINAEAGSAVRKHLQLELDRMQWRHEQELNEIKHNAAIQLAELRLALEHDKEFSLSELRQKFEEEKKKEIEEVKKKQWCANCGKEAIFYCCWNTSYCNYPCQQAHWPKHMHSCTQAPEGSQSHDEPATANQSDDRAAVNVPLNQQQQKWKDNPDLSISAALKQQELDRQLRLTFPVNAGGHQYLPNQTRTLSSIQISSTNNPHNIAGHQQQQQPTPPVVQVQYSTATAYNNNSSSIHMTPYLSNSQQILINENGTVAKAALVSAMASVWPVSILHPQQQQFRLRANQLQHQPGIIMYPGVPTAVLTTRHGNQTIPIGSIPPGPIYQPKKY